MTLLLTTLGRWAHDGVSLAVQERRLLADYPAHAGAIRAHFELAGLQLEALAALEAQNALAFALDLWRFFRYERIEKAAG